MVAKKITNLCVFSMIFLVADCCAANYSDKNVQASRPITSYSVLDHPAMGELAHEVAVHKKSVALQVDHFYQESLNKKDLGTYFGYYARHAGVVRDYIHVENHQFGDLVDADALSNRYVVHYDDNKNLAGTVYLRPAKELNGVDVRLFAPLPFLNQRVFVGVDVPFLQVKSGVRLEADGALRPHTDDDFGSFGKNLLDYFAGNLEETEENHLQQRLLKGKMGVIKNKTGFSDVVANIGYQWINSENVFLTTAVRCTLPFGNKPRGEYVFEPLLGNGGHVGIGIDVNARACAFCSGDSRINLTGNVQADYLFSAPEDRTLGVTGGVAGGKVPLIQYYCGGKHGQVGTFPLANVLTRAVCVFPGLQVQGQVAYELHHKNLSLTLGYHLFAKQEEQVALRSWDNDTYAVAHIRYPTGNLFSTVAADNRMDENVFTSAIQSNNLDLETVRTPAQVSHSIFSSLSYTCGTCRFPLTLGWGGAYEMPTSNALVKNYTVWGSLGFTF